MDPMDFAQHLQALRKQAGYSQEQLAAQLGISRQAVSKWESAQGKPELDKLKKLAELYHVSTDAILSGEVPPSLPPAPREAKKPSTIRRTAALILVFLAYPLSLGLSAAAQILEALLCRALAERGGAVEACIMALYPLVSQPKAQLFFFLSLCLIAVLLFFWDGLPRKQKIRENPKH